jgi:hypothetical protein
LLDAITKNVDLSELNWISYSAAIVSQMRRRVRIADGLGASKEMLSAYANDVKLLFYANLMDDLVLISFCLDLHIQHRGGFRGRRVGSRPPSLEGRKEKRREKRKRREEGGRE